MKDALLLIGGIVVIIGLVLAYALMKAADVPETFLDQNGWEDADE